MMQNLPHAASRVVQPLAALAFVLGAATLSPSAWAAYASVAGFAGRVVGTYEAQATDGARSASADPVLLTVAGPLQGPTPDSLTAGEPVEAGNGTNFIVHGLAGETPLTFVWRITGQHSGVPDADAFALSFAFGLGGGLAQQVLGSFGGLSYVDGPPAQGDFAGSATGSFGGCFVASASGGSVDCPAGTWTGQGTRTMSATSIYGDGWGGATSQILSMAGAGIQTQGQYNFALVEILAPVGTADGAYITFENGRVMSISAVP